MNKEVIAQIVFRPASETPIRPDGSRAYMESALLFNQCDGYHLVFARFSTEGEFDGFYDWCGTEPYEAGRHYCAWALLSDTTALHDAFAERKPALPSRRDLGMYADPSTGVQVGEFNIRRQSDSKVWIERASGEGSEFDDALFEAAVREFYDKYF
jgi:hypothetical protein